MTEVQTLALGQTFAQRNNALAMLGAFSNVRMVPPLEQLKIALVGMRGGGKSALVQSAPGTYIFNFDISPTVIPDRGNMAAMMWPGRHPHTGRAIEGDPACPNDPLRGRPVNLTYETAKEKQELLIKMAQDDVPGRPTTVAIDTTTAFSELVMDWMVRKAAEGGGTTKDGTPITSFSQLHGKQAYPALYRTIYEFGDDLHRAGYGVIWVIHLGDKTVYLDDNRKELLRDVPMLPDNLFNTIGNNTDLLVAVEKEIEKKVAPVPVLGPNKKPVLDTEGKPRMEMKMTETTRYFVTTEPTSERMRNVVKQRAGMPARVYLKSSSPWRSLSLAYQKATVISEPEPATPPTVG